MTKPELTGDETRLADLAQRVIAGKDIPFVERMAEDTSDPETILQRWIEAKQKSWTAMQSGAPTTGDGTTRQAR